MLEVESHLRQLKPVLFVQPEGELVALDDWLHLIAHDEESETVQAPVRSELYHPTIYVSNGAGQIRNKSDDFCHFLCDLHPDFTLCIEIGERIVDFFRECRTDREGRAQRDDSDDACDCHVDLLGSIVALVPSRYAV